MWTLLLLVGVLCVGRAIFKTKSNFFFVFYLVCETFLIYGLIMSVLPAKEHKKATYSVVAKAPSQNVVIVKKLLEGKAISIDEALALTRFQPDDRSSVAKELNLNKEEAAYIGRVLDGKVKFSINLNDRSTSPGAHGR